MKNTNIKEVSFEPRRVTLRELKQINKHSIESDYNRNLNMKEVEEELTKQCKKQIRKSEFFRYDDELVLMLTESTKLLLTPVMIHEHKHLQECEPHLRCDLNLLSKPTSNPMIDVRIEDFENLATHPPVIKVSA